MKPESLTKEKEKTVSEVEFYNNKELLDVKIKSDGNAKEVFTAFEKSDVKSAVQWLLKEIEKEIKYWERAKEHEKDGSQIAYYNRRISELNWCIEKIKKAFSGVLRE